MSESSAGRIPRDDCKLDADYPILVTESSGIAPQYRRLHWHDVLEINLIKRGRGYYQINGKTVEFRQGDILLIGANDLHRAYERENLQMLVITFSPDWFLADLRYDPALLSPFRELGVHYGHLISRNHPRIETLRAILLTLQKEDEHKAVSHISVVRSHLLRFLAYVARDCRRLASVVGGARAGSTPEGRLEKIRDALELMERHYAREWDLKTLSDRVYLSPARFSAVFKQALGVSPMEYLIKVRLSNAVRLLESSDRKIVDVAYECGFHNLSNFNRLFKCNVGVSPSHVRKIVSSGRRQVDKIPSLSNRFAEEREYRFL